MDTPFPHEVFSLVATVKCKSGLRVGLNQVNDENSKLSYLMSGQKVTGENSRINAGSGLSLIHISYFVKIDGIKFRHKVVPGDTCLLYTSRCV